MWELNSVSVSTCSVKLIWFPVEYKVHILQIKSHPFLTIFQTSGGFTIVRSHIPRADPHSLPPPYGAHGHILELRGLALEWKQAIVVWAETRLWCEVSFTGNAIPTMSIFEPNKTRSAGRGVKNNSRTFPYDAVTDVITGKIFDWTQQCGGLPPFKGSSVWVGGWGGGGGEDRQRRWRRINGGRPRIAAVEMVPLTSQLLGNTQPGFTPPRMLGMWEMGGIESDLGRPLLTALCTATTAVKSQLKTELGRCEVLVTRAGLAAVGFLLLLWDDIYCQITI